MAFMSEKSGFIYVVHSKFDLEITKLKIQLWEELGPMKFIQQLIDEWDRKFIFDSYFVQSFVIYAQSERPILLSY